MKREQAPRSFSQDSRIEIKEDAISKLWCRIQRIRTLNREIRRLKREVIKLSYFKDNQEEFAPEVISQLAAAYELRAIMVQECGRLASGLRNRKAGM